jgi:hypothetical protein
MSSYGGGLQGLHAVTLPRDLRVRGRLHGAPNAWRPGDAGRELHDPRSFLAGGDIIAGDGRH